MFRRLLLHQPPLCRWTLCFPVASERGEGQEGQGIGEARKLGKWAAAVWFPMPPLGLPAAWGPARGPLWQVLLAASLFLGSLFLWGSRACLGFLTGHGQGSTIALVLPTPLVLEGEATR